LFHHDIDIDIGFGYGYTIIIGWDMDNLLLYDMIYYIKNKDRREQSSRQIKDKDKDKGRHEHTNIKKRDQMEYGRPK
jgi:hypothetical protein